MKWKPYPSYKPSGVEWLGDVPAHWGTPPLYTRYSIDLGKMLDESRITGAHLVPYLRNVDVQWDRINFEDLPEIDVAPSERGRFTLRAGDLLVCEGGEVGRAAIVPPEGAGFAYQKALHRMRPLRPSLDDPRFVFYLLSAAASSGVFLAEGNPNTIPHLTGEKLRRYRFPMPTVQEQTAIARFLDETTTKLGLLVAKKRALVERLREKRTALISRTVTRGLPPEAARAAGLAPHPNLKPSGIPEGWRESPLMHLVEPRRPIMYGIVLPGPDVDEGVLIVKGGDVKPGRLTPESLCRTTIEIAAGYERSRLRAGDLLFSIRGTVGEVEMVPAGIDGANITQDVARVAPAAEVDGRWLLHALKAEAVVGPLLALSLGAAVRGVNIRDLKRVRIPVPPVREQQAIAEYLDRETARIDRLVEKVEAAIERLQEYRQALITAAVTGKIGVRDKAPGPAAA